MAVRSQLHSELRSLDGMHVRLGTTKKTKRKGLEQKMVDVQLTVDAILHRVRGNFQHAILLAGDADFVPVAQALVELGAYVTVMAYPRSLSQELRDAADAYSAITPYEMNIYCEGMAPSVMIGAGQDAHGNPLESGSDYEVFIRVPFAPEPVFWVNLLSVGMKAESTNWDVLRLVVAEELGPEVAAGLPTLDRFRNDPLIGSGFLPKPQ